MQLKIDVLKQHFAKYWSCEAGDEYRVSLTASNPTSKSLPTIAKSLPSWVVIAPQRLNAGHFLLSPGSWVRTTLETNQVGGMLRTCPIPDHGCNIWAVGLDFSVIRDVIWNEKLRRGHRHPGLSSSFASPLIVRVSDSEFQIQVDVMDVNLL